VRPYGTNNRRLTIFSTGYWGKPRRVTTKLTFSDSLLRGYGRERRCGEEYFGDSGAGVVNDRGEYLHQFAPTGAKLSNFKRTAGQSTASALESTVAALEDLVRSFQSPRPTHSESANRTDSPRTFYDSAP
jgi:hypothetical protein